MNRSDMSDAWFVCIDLGSTLIS